MNNWTIEERRLELIYNWKISRNETFFKINFFVELNHEGITGKGEVAPNIRYNETPDLINKQFKLFIEKYQREPKSLEEFGKVLDQCELCNALRFALESAFIHFFCNKNKITIYELLKIPQPGKIYTSYTIPIIEPGEVKEFIEKHNLGRFKSLKIKINAKGFDLVNEVSKNYTGPLMIDANEAWTNVEDLIQFMNKLKKYNIEFIEQPLPYNLIDEYIYLKKKSPFPIIGDESITNNADFNLLPQQFNGINVKLMKAGGYINGINILKNAKKHGMKTMIGCMVETSLGISSGMHLCGLCDYIDLDGFFLIDKEPFNLVKEADGQLLFNL